MCLCVGDNLRAAQSFVRLTFDGTWSDPESPTVWEQFVVEWPSSDIPEPDGARRPAEVHAYVGDGE